ncbi:MAG: response regulator receiver protein [Bryobacterales bacterium]|jgi:CheY-like chemotaxis protein|nr:response regulator receiver protein [Bryobacterales bacterium]
MAQIDVLLAEDNEADIFLVNEALRIREIDYELKIISNGDEAKQYFDDMARNGHENCPDIFLVDLNLPRAGGFELLEAFRNHCGSKVPVVIMTSSQSPADIARASELGANRYFRKPSELDEFLQLGAVVEELVSPRQ